MRAPGGVQCRPSKDLAMKENNDRAAGLLGNAGLR